MRGLQRENCRRKTEDVQRRENCGESKETGIKKEQQSEQTVDSSFEVDLLLETIQQENLTNEIFLQVPP